MRWSLIVLLAFCSSCSGSTEKPNREIIVDQFTFPPGEIFNVEVQANNDEQGVSYFWRDYKGNAITTPVENQSTDSIQVSLPSTDIGYYGLVQQSASGEKEYGYLIQPVESEAKRPSSTDLFGMVHADYNDKGLSSWVKTLTWNTLAAKHWAAQISKIRQAGKIEVPMITGREWETEDSTRVTDEQLQALGSRLREYFAADPTVIYWELGREENLQARYNRRYYWENLNRKVSLAREVADSVNPQIEFIYQVAAISLDPIKVFAQSEVAKLFSILSLHPYSWPEFPDTDSWLFGYLENVKTILAENNHESTSLWITEIGVPHHPNSFGGYFNMPRGNPVRGFDLLQSSIALVKTHIIALRFGIEKVFWYNYRDAGTLEQDPENFFGLINFDGYPRPAYAAYTNLIRLLENTKSVGSITQFETFRKYDFESDTQLVSVLWSDSDRVIPLTQLDSVVDRNAENSRLIGLTGALIPINSASIQVGLEPVFLVTQK